MPHLPHRERAEALGTLLRQGKSGVRTLIKTARSPWFSDQIDRGSACKSGRRTGTNQELQGRVSPRRDIGSHRKFSAARPTSQRRFLKPFKNSNPGGPASFDEPKVTRRPAPVRNIRRQVVGASCGRTSFDNPQGSPRSRNWRTT